MITFKNIPILYLGSEGSFKTTNSQMKTFYIYLVGVFNVVFFPFFPGQTQLSLNIPPAYNIQMVLRQEAHYYLSFFRVTTTLCSFSKYVVSKDFGVAKLHRYLCGLVCLFLFSTNFGRKVSP